MHLSKFFLTLCRDANNLNFVLIVDAGVMLHAEDPGVLHLVHRVGEEQACVGLIGKQVDR